jgi:hypothetical protein
MTTSAPEKHSEPWLHEPRLLDVRLIVHTHWDREWYRPFPQFRARLVALVNEVLEGRAGAPFLLDGQAVVLEDYLEVHPERSADVSNGLRQGAIEAGPWYVLADSLIPSAEGLVRNLLAGRRVLRSLRAVAPDVLYCPDSFGHPAALPAIATGFGIGSVVLWRGYGGQSHPWGDTARWVAPDESVVTLYHLPPDGYEFGSHLPQEADAATERWNAIREVLAPRATTGLVLLTVGADHHAPAANLVAAIEALRTTARPDAIERSSLAQFGQELSQRTVSAALPFVRGELRDSYGYTWALQGTLGARAGLKRRYARAESQLLRDCEPWVALARRLGDGIDRRALTRAAWKPLLQCQPHDTLCGCSVDEVADAMAHRVSEATSAAAELRDAALAGLIGQDGNEARRRPADWAPVVLVRNRTARLRSGVAECDIDLVLDDAPVGPSSAGIEPRARQAGKPSVGMPSVSLQEISSERTFAREEASRHYPWNRLIERRRMLAWVSDVPGYGLVALPVHEQKSRTTRLVNRVGARGRAIFGNGWRVEAHRDRVSLTTADGFEIADWISFEAQGERGDLYTHSPIADTRGRSTLVRSRVTARGPLRSELSCTWRVLVPERRLTSAAGEPRIAPAARLEFTTAIQVDSGAPFVRVIVRGNNVATDVQLRFGLASTLSQPMVMADAAFGPIQRQAIRTHNATEAVTSTAPLHRYVSLYGDAAGVSIYSDGLAEYEVDDDAVTWVTLVRAVGELSRHNLPERPGHAGYPVQTPAAQSTGPLEASFAFAVHGPRSDSTVALVEMLADDVLLPLQGETLRTAINPPAVIPGAELDGDGLSMTSIKESEDGEWLVLRCVNVLDQPVAGSWTLSGIREAMLARLDETPLEGVPVNDNRIEFVAPARGIVTLRVR